MKYGQPGHVATVATRSAGQWRAKCKVSVTVLHRIVRQTFSNVIVRNTMIIIPYSKPVWISRCCQQPGASALRPSGFLTTFKNRRKDASPILKHVYKRYKRTLPKHGATLGAVDNGSNTAPCSGEPVLVWYKHDLRVDDHPGLQLALRTGRPLLFLYCFDASTLTHLLRVPLGIEALHVSVASLKAALRARGGILLLQEGPWETMVPAIVEQYGITQIITEEEVEHRWLEGLAAVEAKLGGGVQLTKWRLSLFEDVPYPDNYREFVRKMGPPTAAVAPPTATLPCAMSSINEANKQTDLPAVSYLRSMALAAACDHVQPSLRPLIQQQVQQPASEYLFESGLQGTAVKTPTSSNSSRSGTGVVEITAQDKSNSGTSASVVASGAPRPQWPCMLEQGEDGVADALHEYIRFLEGVPAKSSSALSTAVTALELPATRGGSFRGIFSPALQHGVLSRRRAYLAAQQYLASRRPAAAFRFRSPKTWQAVEDGCVAWDYYWQMACEDRVRVGPSGYSTKHWRWDGVLTDFVMAEPSTSSDKPAILLVHGFGAFGNQWRDQIQPLADAGYRVFAPTFPGYGRSEKPPLQYGQDLWRDFLRDFVLEVVREPVVVAGNSIGGFISASLSADYPQLVKGLVLINSAGRIMPGYQPPAAPPKPGRPPPGFVVDAISSGLFSYLEGNIRQQLAKLYPTNPQRADEWLAEEIYRAACDPGALGVFRSVFYLPPPRPLNYLVDNFGGPCMVFQGVLDPLNDARSRALQLQSACVNQVLLELVQAGHCPFDEVPGQFNSALLNFVSTQVLGGQQQQPCTVAAA